MKSYILIIIALIFLFGCKKDEVKDSNDTAKYKVTFNIDWNSNTFPIDYPSSAHFSKLIGWTHRSNNNFISLGSYASTGIKKMAEQGSTAPLDDEINTRIAINEGYQLIRGNNLGTGVGQIIVEIEVHKDFPALSLVSMIAPSPDWYIGIININLIENGSFVNEKIVNAHIYDAGTDDGLSYKSANINSNPQGLITLFVDPPLGDGISIEEICEVTIKKL